MNKPEQDPIKMTRRERLMSVFSGDPVDSLPVCFYELNALDQYPNPDDPFNIYSGSNWNSLLQLTRDRSARILMRSPVILDTYNPLDDLRQVESFINANGSRIERTTISLGKRQLTQITRRDPDLETVWVIEHYIKTMEDLKTWLLLPRPVIGNHVNISAIQQDESIVGDSGIVMLDMGDPICSAAGLFEMGLYTVVAYTEQKYFHSLLDWFAEGIWQRTAYIAEALPGHLWRIPGPEYASPPYLPPKLFHDYVVDYDIPMVQSIQKFGGFARLHSHGRLRQILDEILSMGIDGLDPVEPPPQGDMELAKIRQRCGDEITLFGNIEISEIETLDKAPFRRRVEKAVQEGVDTNGSHFVLMPTACPLGRILSEKTLRNYEIMLDVCEH